MTPEPLAELKRLAEKWREEANRPGIRLSDTRLAAFIAERTEGADDARRLCADELDAALPALLEELERLRGGAQENWKPAQPQEGERGEPATQLEYKSKDGRSHFRVSGGNCICGWTIINDFEWQQHLKQEKALPKKDTDHVKFLRRALKMRKRGKS